MSCKLCWSLRSEGLSCTHAIDHIFVNHRFLDIGARSWTEYSKWTSNHFRVIASWGVPRLDTMIRKWPEVMKFREKVPEFLEWRPVVKNSVAQRPHLLLACPPLPGSHSFLERKHSLQACIRVGLGA